MNQQGWCVYAADDCFDRDTACSLMTACPLLSCWMMPACNLHVTSGLAGDEGCEEVTIANSGGQGWLHRLCSVHRPPELACLHAHTLLAARRRPSSASVLQAVAAPPTQRPAASRRTWRSGGSSCRQASSMMPASVMGQRIRQDACLCWAPEAVPASVQPPACRLEANLVGTSRVV
jgi:hypothetical protein